MSRKAHAAEQEAVRGRAGGGYEVRPAGGADQPALINLLGRYICGANNEARYQWLYRKNPQGPAQAWVATLEGSDRIVGFTSMFARDVSVGGELIPAGVGFDAYVLPEHRGQGLATLLHQESRLSMARREVPYRFMFGPPVAKNLRALVRAGSRVVGGLRYLSLPLSSRGIFGTLGVGGSLLARAIERTRMVDAALDRVRRLLAGGTRQTTVRPVFRTTEAFDRLFAEIAPRIPVIGRRDAAYLDWRYRQNPVCEQELVAIDHGGRLLGWAALENGPRGCLLVDYLLPLDPDEGRVALGALVQHVASLGAPRLTLRFNLDGPYRNLFLKQGFLPGRTREDWQCLVGELFLPALHEPDGWHLTSGDLNPEASPWTVNELPPEAVPAGP